MGEPFLRRAVGDRADFGRAVVLGDHRTPPLDHAALDVRRAGRADMHHADQARHVVARLDRRRAAPAAARTSSAPPSAWVTRCSSIVAQHLLGVEARLDDQVGAHPVELEHPAVRAGVIGGPGDQQHDLVQAICPAIQRSKRDASSAGPPPSAPASAAGGARPWDGLSCRRCRSSIRARSGTAARPARRPRSQLSQSILPSGTARIRIVDTVAAARRLGGVSTTMTAHVLGHRPADARATNRRGSPAPWRRNSAST